MESQNNNQALVELPDMGRHLVLDFVNVEEDLNNYELLDTRIREILSKTQVTIEGHCFKKFEPQGVTSIYLLSESHFSIHTWPERKSCAIDFYHCGDRAPTNLKLAEELICDWLGWENCTSTLLLKRGCMASYLTNDFVDKTEILRNVKLLHRERSDFQEIRVYDTIALGRILVLDGAVQISSISMLDDNYTKDLTDSVVKRDRDYEHVVIIGAGDLIIPAYVLEKFPNVKKVTVAEIDGRVVEVTKKFFSIGEIIEKELSSGRLEIKIMGGAEYMAELLEQGKAGTVGAVVIDCTDYALDENSIAASLFTKKFYSSIHELLEKDGGFSQQITKIFYKEAFTNRVNSSGFNDVDIILSQTPEYGGELPLAVCYKH